MNKEIARIIHELVGTNNLLFNDAIRVRLSPHQWPINVHGVCVNTDGRVALFDGDVWHELKETDDRYTIVSNSIYQRLKTIQKQKRVSA